MANVKALINVNMAGNGDIDLWTSNLYSNNKSPVRYSNNIKPLISIMDITYKEFGGALLYTMGSSIIGQKRICAMNKSGLILPNNYKGLMLPRTYNVEINGQTSTITANQVIMHLEGVDILNLKIYFDRITHQYPRLVDVVLDGVAYQTLHPEEEMVHITDLPTGNHSIDIYLANWNNDDELFKITFIEFPEIAILLDKTSIRLIQTQSQISSDNAHPQYGILASTGSLSLQDKNGDIYRKAELGYFDANKFETEIYLNNNLIQSHYSISTPYFSADSSMNIQLTNKLELWKDIEVPDIEYAQNTNLFQVFYDVIHYDETIEDDYEIDSMLQKHILIYDGTTLSIKEYMQRINIPPFTLKSNNLTNQINKICTVAQLEACLDDVGQLKFFSARPVACREDLANVIEVPFQKQRSKMAFNLLKDNKYNKVNFR